jgi:hypothetical protein
LTINREIIGGNIMNMAITTKFWTGKIDEDFEMFANEWECLLLRKSSLHNEQNRTLVMPELLKLRRASLLEGRGQDVNIELVQKLIDIQETTELIFIFKELFLEPIGANIEQVFTAISNGYTVEDIITAHRENITGRYLQIMKKFINKKEE